MQHGKNGAVGGVVIQSTGWLSMAFVTLFLMMAVNVMSATSRTVMAVTDGEQEDDQVCNSTSAGTAASGAKKKRLVDDWSFSTTISSIDGGGLRMMEAAESPSVDDVLKPPCRMMTTHSSRSSWLPPRPHEPQRGRLLLRPGKSVNIWTTLLAKKGRWRTAPQSEMRSAPPATTTTITSTTRQFRLRPTDRPTPYWL